VCTKLSKMTHIYVLTNAESVMKAKLNKTNESIPSGVELKCSARVAGEEVKSQPTYINIITCKQFYGSY